MYKNIIVFLDRDSLEVRLGHNWRKLVLNEEFNEIEVI